MIRKDIDKDTVEKGLDYLLNGKIDIHFYCDNCSFRKEWGDSLRDKNACWKTIKKQSQMN